MNRSIAGVVALGLLAACAGVDSQTRDTGETGKTELQLDDVYSPPAGVSLVVLGPKADRDRFADVVAKLDGIMMHAYGARLAVARLPLGAEAILAQAGMVAHYERAVDPAEVAGSTLDEQRFVRVFDNRYYAPATPRALVSTMLRAARPAGAPFEATPSVAPVAAPPPLRIVGPGFDAAPPPVVDRNTTPFASGTIVVSIVLPESNGVAEPSTEDWTEDAIVETYQKVQTALESFQRTEPNADLHFILHYESSPGSGGLPGTVDSDYELGKHADFNDSAGEAMVSAPILARLVGHAVTQDQVWDASYEYLNALRDRYKADGAYYIKVANNRSSTGGLRAHAYINGPWTTLSTDYGWETFMHETGHIFGALDEYCPDQCIPTTAQQGYLGMPNANATLRPGGDGINGGQGEDMSSLMMYNVPSNVQGYSRGAWGWLDTDGDGILEVRDTLPKSALTAVVSGARVRLQGTVTDVPATRIWGDGASFNKITLLEYRASDRPGAPWLAVPVTGTVRGVATVDLDLGAFPRGTQSIDVRAVNSVGNVEPAPQKVTFTVSGTAANSAPRVRLATSSAVGSTRSTFTLDASSFDFDGDAVQVRFDTNGDGRFDTPFAATTRTTARFASPGVYTAVVEAKDARGATSQARAEILVEDGNALPRVTLSPVASPAFGTDTLDETLRITSAVDPDGDPLEFNWTAEVGTTDQVFTTSSGFAAANTIFPAQLRTPLTLRTQSVDLTGGQPAPKMQVQKVVAVTPTLLATAAGDAGVLFTDITSPAAPRLVARLDLQTEADQLLLDGKRLFVFGATLVSVVDLTKPAAPVEIAQASAFKATRTTADASEAAIDDGNVDGFAAHYHFATFGERIASLGVDVTVDHPAPADLTFTLLGPSGAEVTLRDHVAGPAGSHTYSFTTASTPALSAFAGLLASGQWRVAVKDGVAGNAGTLTSSTLTFRTSSKAAPVMPNAHAVGVLSGRYVVLAGLGVQVLDAQAPKAIKAVAQLTGTGTYGAGLSGSTLIGIGPLEVPPPKGKALAEEIDLARAASTAPQTRGLYAVDLSNPKKPVVKRNDLSFAEAGTLFTQGTRFYLTPNPAGGKGGGDVAPPTGIDSVSAFAAGGAYALGTMPFHVHHAFGDDRTMWALDEQGSPVSLDVSSAARVVVTQSLFRPQVSDMTSIGDDRVVFLEGSPTVRLANIHDTSSITSRVFRITVEARDGHGTAVVSRAQHVIPYDHAPTLDSVTVTSGATTSDDFVFTLAASDPDGAPTWDPTLYARADLDGDGIFEGNWTMLPGKDPLTFTTRFASAGARTLHFQVRDGFYATSSRDLAVQVR
jgi:subtilisin-like proprotein convertase family protein